MDNPADQAAPRYRSEADLSAKCPRGMGFFACPLVDQLMLEEKNNSQQRTGESRRKEYRSLIYRVFRRVSIARDHLDLHILALLVFHL